MKFTIAYTLLFMYVIAAIVFWGYSLNKQNKLIYALEKEKIELQQDHLSLDRKKQELQRIQDKKIRRTKQYLGEGSTFILIILLTAGIVYVAYYRQRALARLQHNFMLSVTHELKTPIAGIKLNIQTLEKRKLDEGMQKKLLAASVTETNRLNDLCNNILVATQLESKKHALYTEELDMKQLVEEVAAQMKQRYTNLQLLVELMPRSFQISGDRALWQLVISNLLENARKYSPEGAPITIQLQQQGKKTVLSVSDQGIGIPDAEKAKIFQKFYRVGSENTRSSKGTGLGLYIVKKIVSMYKYDITVKNNSAGGATFEVLFG
jgi:K+-sensing histidine kinase KdpD